MNCCHDFDQWEPFRYGLIHSASFVRVCAGVWVCVSQRRCSATNMQVRWCNFSCPLCGFDMTVVMELWLRTRDPSRRLGFTGWLLLGNFGRF